MHLNAQSYQLETEEDKIMLVISYLIEKAADWIQLYVNRNDEENKIFSNYNKFVKKITAVFKSVNFKKKTECKLEHFKQKKFASNYIIKFRQIVSVLNWDNEMYVLLFYWKFKNQVKNELIKIEWSDDLNDMIKIIIWIDNWLWKK